MALILPLGPTSVNLQLIIKSAYPGMPPHEGRESCIGHQNMYSPPLRCSA
jgi:hypothetical protein